MPIYEYRCDGCGFATDQLRPVERRDDGLSCPRCGRLLSRPVCRFKTEKPFVPYDSVSMGCCQDDERLPGEHYNERNEVRVTSPDHRRRLMKRLRMRDASTYVS